ncbi:related to nuclear envelope protein NEM1 [Melanopsichium pennsylvanicum]|uniref:Related to nuclear envelope protein NEM1 n=2 Tax=Melanopsichium pennsylvanicum TaxID=63383 RepID=A0AAJ4XMT9_9BASI|nr:related to nuclear envelope protein NEM1 [Melanopsichium pennsylvanicum 4]SNX85764.1 related to nuclear envelope protein NEM1 [Melanopsichium pennsylvanicum]
MNSISYLDSVLSRSFAPHPDPPSSRPASSAKRSRSHSSLQGSRRLSSTSASTPNPSSSLRRWSQEQDHARPIYKNALRRTGSTPASTWPTHALDTDDSDSDSRHSRRARWSGLWGLTGWLDEAIHPGSRNRSRKNSDSELSYPHTKRVPSLDDLLLSSTAPRRGQARRTVSSGIGQAHSRRHDESGTHESHGELVRSSSKRHSRFGASASLTLTAANHHQSPDTWTIHDSSVQRHRDPELMTEKEREDVVEFDGGDFAPEDIDRPRERTISQSSADSSWAEGSSISHEAAQTLAATTAADSTPLLEHKSDGADSASTQDEGDEKSIDSETLLKAAKGEPGAIEAVAHEHPSSSVVDLEATSATPKKDPAASSDADVKPNNHHDGLIQLDTSTSVLTTPSTSRMGSLRRNRDTPIDSLASSSSTSLASTGTAEAVKRILTPSKSRKRRSARSTPNSSDRASESEGSRQWLASHNGNSAHIIDPPTPHNGAVPHRKRSSSTKRAVRRTLIAIRDLLIAVLLCPVNCVRYLRRHRVIRAEEAIEAVYERAQVPILEKGETSYHRASPDRSNRSPSLRFESESKRDGGKRNSTTACRPRTPRLDGKDASVFRTGPFEREMVTEDQAAELTTAWKAVASGQRTPSRLLPNPQTVDPMLAHSSKAEPIDTLMAEKEAMMEAERQSRIAKGRAARLAARANGTDPSLTSPTSPPPSSVLLRTKVPRGPSSSIIHHSPKILVLDLDETLIHSTSRSPSHHSSSSSFGRTTTSGFLGLETAGAILGLRANDNPRRIRPHMVEVVLDGRSVLYHVYKRPWTDYFLRKVASWYTVVVFTASVQEYADPVIDWLDQGRGLISARLFRESCSFKSGSYVKNLAVVDEDLSKVCLVDNSPASYKLNRANGIPIEGWTSDPNDEALLDLLPILDSLRFASDVRHILGIRGW